MCLKRVRIDGGTLLISNYWKEIEVPVREVVAVRGSDWSNGQITITFEHDTEFGKSIMFIPEVRFFEVWGPHPVVGAILEAARQAREHPHR